MSEQRLHVLKEHLKTLEAFIKSPAHEGWKTARLAEVDNFNMQISIHAESWDEVLTFRGQRDNTLALITSFEDTRASLKDAIDDIVDKQTNSTSGQ